MIKSVKQQGINKMGDCGQCCLAGITGKSVKEIYDSQERIDGLSYFTMLSLIKKLGLIYDNKLPHLDDWRKKDGNEEWQTFGLPSYILSYEWLQNGYTKIKCGWIGLCLINFSGNAIDDEFADHWVIVNNIKFNNEGLYNDDNVFISCPNRGEYSINVKKFLKYYGGYNAIWIKIDH